MTLRQFINKLQSYKESYMEKEIKIVCENGILSYPELKLVLNNRYDTLNCSASNVEFIIIKGE